MMATARQEGSRANVFVVALTGGIASGKSTVSGLFEELGVPVIDTDVIARELVEPGQPLLSSIVATLGQELLDAYGRLKRKKLRNLIFSSRDKRLQLEALMHPAIAEEARRRIGELDGGYCLLVIPLLAEKGGYAGVDRVLVVNVDPAIQIQRLKIRDGASKKQARLILAAQATPEQRLAIADDVIENSGEIAVLREKVQELHRLYSSLSGTAESEPQK
jgi:dephospho-CoA kinase